jgi:ZIP family zinc transporter
MKQPNALAHPARSLPIAGISPRTIRRWVGIAIAASGAVLVAGQLAAAASQAWSASETLRQGVAAALLAGLATGLGALPLLFVRNVSTHWQGALFAIAGGLMFGAAAFGLLIPALGAAGEFGFAGVAASAVLGALMIAGFDRLLPHLHAIPDGLPGRTATRAGGLMVVAIGLHNLPEGLAVGASFQGGTQPGTADATLGIATALGIGIQNLPEGLIVALAMTTAGASRPLAVAIATLTGLFEPLGALVGGAAAGIASNMLPLAMAFAAGAMLFVIAHDVVPNAARMLRRRSVAVGLLGGTAAMALLAF